MKRIAALLLSCCFGLTACQQNNTDQTNRLDEQRDLLVLAAPKQDSKYYTKIYQRIMDFEIAFIKQIMGHDNVVFLVDEQAKAYVSGKLPSDILLDYASPDIWLRDFATIHPKQPIQFQYSAVGQAGRPNDSKEIQQHFKQLLLTLKLDYKQSNLILDGGNFVDNHAGAAVVTERFLHDNEMTEETAKRAIKELTPLENVAILPNDSLDGLAHVEDMLMFIDENTLVINQYDPPYSDLLTDKLRQAFPKMKLLTTPVDWDKTVWDKYFSSSCGLYVNAVMTKSNLYVPQFATETDARVLSLIQSNTSRKVLPVDTSEICVMGGNVRSLTWQVSGENAARLIEAARTS